MEWVFHLPAHPAILTKNNPNAYLANVGLVLMKFGLQSCMGRDGVFLPQAQLAYLTTLAKTTSHAKFFNFGPNSMKLGAEVRSGGQTLIHEF